jgi:hypothetical protein
MDLCLFIYAFIIETKVIKKQLVNKEKYSFVGIAGDINKKYFYL